MLKNSKKVLAVLMAMLTLCFCFAIGASAVDTTAITVSHTLQGENKNAVTVNVEPATSDYILGSWSCDIVPSADKNGSNFFYNLERGKEYAVIVSAQVKLRADLDYTSVVKTYKFTIKKAQATPTNNDYTITKTAHSLSFKVNQNGSKSLSVALFDMTGEPISRDMSKTNEFYFGNLEPYTQYQAEIKCLATETEDESEAISPMPTIRTLKTGKTDALIPMPAKVTKNSITLKAVEGYQYSKDNGVSWQDSATFSGLAANKEYQFVQREKFDPKEQEENAKSAVQKIQTNRTDNTIPTVNKSLFKITSSKIYSSNRPTEFTVKGAKPDKETYEIGDIKFIPTKIFFNDAAVNINSTSALEFKGSYTFPKKGTYKVKVVYTEMKYWFKFDANGVIDGEQWVENTKDNGTVATTEVVCDSVTANSEYNPVLNFFQELMNSIGDIFNKLADLINKLIG